MTDIVLTQPSLSYEQVMQWVEDAYGKRVSVQPLDSERDQNFLLLDRDTQEEFVFRISNTDTSDSVLDLENRMMLHIVDRLGGSVPVPIENRLGQFISRGCFGSQEYQSRLFDFLAGELLVNARPHSDRLLSEIGGLLGRITKSLEDFRHPAAERQFHWNLDQVEQTITLYRGSVENFPAIDSFLERYRTRVLPQLGGLRKSVIQNDANDHNLVVRSQNCWPQAVVGLIDFGDVVFASTINELAICVAYVMLEKDDPLWAAAQVVRGYHEEFLLAESELEVLFDLARARLFCSVVMAAHQRQLQPTNEYLSVTDEPARRLLKKLENIDSDFAACYFQRVCDFLPIDDADFEPAKTGVIKQQRIVKQWLVRNQESIHPIFSSPFGCENTLVFDLGVSSPTALLGDELKAGHLDLQHRLESEGFEFGLGRYCEPRVCYQGDQYRTCEDPAAELRSIHIGMDVFVREGAPVFAPLDSTIHSFANNDLAFDYGPTIILQHCLPDGARFYTLYGHLSGDSLNNCLVGMSVAAGERFATVGNENENGGWPPHVHFQIITNMLGKHGDFPGVASPRELAVWNQLSPDPNWILKVPEELLKSSEMDDQERFVIRKGQPGQMESAEIMERRKTFLNPSLSLSYDHPIQLVRGRRQYLFDGNGQPFLDCVNNVCHVGHCHPAVVTAGRKQMEILNTNTRYLHRSIVQYAERIAATLPDGLDVCYFLNSGSEANDLALRLARHFTGRESVICVEGGYHGHTGRLIDVSPYKFNSRGGAGCPDKTIMLARPDGFRGEFRFAPDGDHGETGWHYANQLRMECEKDGGNRDIAALICESILSCGGQVVLPDNYLQEVYRIVREQGGVCIADEVQVGFGRVGEAFWGFQLQGVCPDIVTMGKPMGNGHPLAALVTTREIADAFNNGMEYFNTFGGNPVSCEIGMAVLDVIENENLQENAKQVGGYLLSRLRELQDRFQIIGDVRGRGLFIGIELVYPHDQQGLLLEPHAAAARYIVERMKSFRVLLSTDGPDENVIKIKPPLVFQKENADTVVALLERVLQEDFLAE